MFYVCCACFVFIMFHIYIYIYFAIYILSSPGILHHLSFFSFLFQFERSNVRPEFARLTDGTPRTTGWLVTLYSEEEGKIKLPERSMVFQFSL